MIQKAIWVLKGFIMGVACLIPGVSAGTLALIMGVYEKIILSINEIIRLSIKRKTFVFLLCLSLGLLLAVFCLAEGMSWLLSTFPIELYCFFAGLILASIPKLFHLTDKTKSSLLITSVTALTVCIVFTMFPDSSKLNQTDLFLFFISGFFGCFASILPGLSGSTVLLIIGTYHLILKTLAESIMGIDIIVFSIGGVLGLVFGFYCIRYFLKHKKNLFFCVVLGLIIGSLPKILPWKEWSATDTNMVTMNGFVFCFIGVILFFLLEKAGKMNNK